MEKDQHLSTHRIPDEVLQRAALDKLGDQVEPLVLVEHTDEPQHVGVVEASHDLDLQPRGENTQAREDRKSDMGEPT